MSKSIRKFRSKTLDNFGNVFSYQIQHKYDSSSRDRFAPMSERYKRNNLRIHVHMRGIFFEFCAILQYTDSTEGDIREIDNIGSSQSAYNGPNSGLSAYDLNKPMLVRIVDLIEPKEGAIAPSVFGPIKGYEVNTTSAFVWLQPLNNCLMFRSEQLKHLFPFSIFEFLPTSCDRPLKIPCDCFRYVRSFQEGKLIDKLIKSRAQVMGNFSDINTPFKGGWQSIHTYAPDILSRLRIELRPDNVISSILCKSILHRPESINFSFCTSDLEAWAIERMHMLYSTYGREEDGHSKDPTELRNPHPEAQGRVRRTRKSDETDQASSSPPPPEEVKSRTALYHHHGGYTAKHTHSGSLEDV